MAGNWAGPYPWTYPAIHTIHVPVVGPTGVGSMLLWGFGGNLTTPDATLWNGKITGAALTDFPKYANNYANVFCSGHCHLSDGKVLVAGGHIANDDGTNLVEIFNPFSPSWAATGSMAYGRWYPTATELPSGDVLVTGGSRIVSGEIEFVPYQELWSASSGTFSTLASGANKALNLYPWMFVIPADITVGGASFPKGSVFLAGPTRVTQFLKLGSSPAWSSNILRGGSGGPLTLSAGSAVMYAPGKIMVCGGAVDETTAALNKTYIIDVTGNDPVWSASGDMNYPRRQHNLVLLPDGRVLAIGGVKYGADSSNSFLLPEQVYPAEIWDPATGTWTTVESMVVPRWYHSTAMLMNDARIIAAGGNVWSSMEAYTPDQYTHAGRPVILSCPSVIHYGTDFQLALDGDTTYTLSKVTLLKLGAVTHGFDQSQRFLNLTFATNGVGTITPPANANYAPPGYYMLFAFYTIGGVLVPSVAKYVQLTT